MKLPLTIRTARKDDVPASYHNAIAKANEANIREGYTLSLVHDKNQKFGFFCEINIDTSRFWDVFTSLLLTYNTEISLIIQHIDDEPFYGRYTDKFEILNALSKYQLELSVDPYLEFGVLFDSDTKLKEIFIPKAKYIQYWGTDLTEFEEIMENFSIYKNNELNFIDEFPLVTEPSSLHYHNITHTGEIIKNLKEDFIIKKLNQ